MIHLNIKFFVILVFTVYLNAKVQKSIMFCGVISRHTCNIAKCSSAITCNVCEYWTDW